jgi:hypothetical protein
MRTTIVAVDMVCDKCRGLIAYFSQTREGKIDAGPQCCVKSVIESVDAKAREHGASVTRAKGKIRVVCRECKPRAKKKKVGAK